MLQRNMDAEAHKSRDSNETNPSDRQPYPVAVHEFTVPHLAARVPFRRLLKRMSSAQQQRLFHMSTDNLKTDRKTFCRLAAR
jgi:hypothetical protein